MTIEGIPEGWELVRIGKVHTLEYYLDDFGRIMQWKTGSSSAVNYVIIRKIEKLKRYRPFANAAEFEPHRDRWVKRLDSLGSASRISGYGDNGVVIHGDIFTFNGLFRDHTFDDGTPFGIEVTE